VVPEYVFAVEVTGGVYFKYLGKMQFKDFFALKQRFHIGFDSEASALGLVEKGDEILQYINCRSHYIRKP
jgi:hypothetical protein